MKRKIAILLSGIMVASAVPMTASAARLDPDKVLNASFSKINEPIDVDAYNFFDQNVNIDFDYPDYKPTNTDVNTNRGEVKNTLPKSGAYLTKEQLTSRKSVVKINLTENMSGSVLENPTFRVTLENGTFDEEYLENYLYTNVNKIPDATNPTKTTTTGAVTWKIATVDRDSNDELTLTEIYQNIIGANIDTTTKSSVYTPPKDVEQSWVEATGTGFAAGTKLIDATNKDSVLLKALAATQRKIKENNGTTNEITLNDGTTVTLSAGNPEPFMQVFNDEALKIDNKFEIIDSYSELLSKIKDEYVEERTKGYNVTDKDFLPNIPYTFERVSDKEAIITVTGTFYDEDTKVSVPIGTTVDKNSLGAVKFTNGSDVTPVTFDQAGISTMTDIVIEGNNGSGGHTTVDKTITVENPYIALPLGGVVADAEGPVKAKITADYTDKVTAKEFVLNVGSETGTTSLVYNGSDVRTFEDQVELGKVLVKENSRNTIGKDTEISVDRNGKYRTKNGIKDSLQFDIKLNSGFKFTNSTQKETSIIDKYNNVSKPREVNAISLGDFDNYNGDEIKIAIEAAKAVTGTELFKYVDMQAELVNDNHIRVTMLPKLEQRPTNKTLQGLEVFGDNRQYPIGVAVEKLDIKPVSDSIYGDATITISGDGINTQTTTVAKREKLGFQLKTLKDPKEIISGRHYTQDTRNMTDSDNTTVEIQFSEGVPNTLVESRNLDFTLPEGVKIADAEVYDYKNLKDIGDDNFEILNNGRTLRLRRINNTNSQNGSKYTVVDKVNKVANFKMKLDLSVEPGFTGDIKLGVTGGGQSDTVETVIAKAINPVEVKTSTTKVNLGYQDYNTADITITENRPGMLLSDKDVVLELKAPYGVQEVGFSQAKLEVSGDELSVKDRDFSVSNGKIKFRIDRS